MHPRSAFSRSFSSSRHRRYLFWAKASDSSRLNARSLAPRGSRSRKTTPVLIPLHPPQIASTSDSSSGTCLRQPRPPERGVLRFKHDFGYASKSVHVEDVLRRRLRDTQVVEQRERRATTLPYQSFEAVETSHLHRGKETGQAKKIHHNLKGRRRDVLLRS